MKLTIPNNWLPTPDNINSLPEPLRKYIHDLASFCGSDLIQENFELLQNFKGAKELMLMYRNKLKRSRMKTLNPIIYTSFCNGGECNLTQKQVGKRSYTSKVGRPSERIVCLEHGTPVDHRSRECECGRFVAVGMQGAVPEQCKFCRKEKNKIRARERAARIRKDNGILPKVKKTVASKITQGKPNKTTRTRNDRHEEKRKIVNRFNVLAKNKSYDTIDFSFVRDLSYQKISDIIKERKSGYRTPVRVRSVEEANRLGVNCIPCQMLFDVHNDMNDGYRK